MQQAIVSTLPFLGQIVKVTTRDGKEYEQTIFTDFPITETDFVN